MEEIRNQIKNCVQREILIEMLYIIYPGLNIDLGGILCIVYFDASFLLKFEFVGSMLNLIYLFKFKVASL